MSNSIETSIEKYTEQRLEWILSKAPENTRKAMLAELRKGVGREPGEIPSLFGILLQGMPEKMYGQGQNASKEERAVYTAITLFAVHQQGHDPQKEPMHVADKQFGTAVAGLAGKDEESRDRIIRRFTQAITSTDLTEFAHHLRSIIQLLRDQSIPMNYARLAADLYRFQSPAQASNVRLRWGEDFYSSLQYSNDNEEDQP